MEHSLQSYHNLLERLQDGVARLDDVLLILPANEFIADLNERIAIKGLDSDGTRIGNYSTKPWYATEASFTNKANFKPGLKKNGERRKSITLEEGYFELRKLDGQRNDTVVLERTGAGLKNIKVGIPENHQVAVGFTDDNEAIKFRAYEERKDKQILSPTVDELERISEAQIREYKIFITEIFAQ